MSLTAVVRRSTGFTRHRIASHAGVQDVPPVVRVRIEPETSGHYLFRFDASGTMVADTWHETVDEAKEQARLEYMIEADAWSIATDPDHNGPQNPGAVTAI